MPTLDELQKDQGFMSATPADQVKFLSETDPSFKAAHPDDQAAFLAHVTKQPTGAEPYAPAKDLSGAMDVASEHYEKGKGIMSGLGRAAAGIPQMGKMAYHAVADAPKDEEEQAAENVGSESPLGRIGGRASLAAKRMLLDPSIAATEHVNEMAQTQEDKAKAEGGQVPLQGKIAKYAGRGLAAVPMAGPFALQLGERAGKGDVSGALAEGAAYSLAPEALHEAMPGGALPGAVAEGARPFPTADATVRGAGTALRTLGEKAPDVGAVVGGTVGALKGNPASAYFEMKGGHYAGKLLGKPLEKAGTALENFGQTPEEKAVTHLEREFKKADNDAQKAQAEYDSYEAGRQAGVPAPEKVLSAHQKAQTHLQLITEHLRLAKEAAEAAKAPAAPDQPIALTPEQEAAQAEKPTPTKEQNDSKLKQLMDQIAAEEKAAATPQNVKLPGQVQPETFPQEPTAAPVVDESTRMRSLAGDKGVMLGRKPLMLGEGTPEAASAAPEAPKQPLGEILPPEKKATAAEMAGLKPVGGKVIEAPEKSVAPLVAEGLKKGNEEAKPFAVPPEHAELHEALSKYEAQLPTEDQKPIEEALAKHEEKLKATTSISEAPLIAPEDLGLKGNVSVRDHAYSAAHEGEPTVPPKAEEIKPATELNDENRRQIEHRIGKANADELLTSPEGIDTARRLIRGTNKQYADMANYLGMKGGTGEEGAWKPEDFKRSRAAHGGDLSPVKEQVINEMRKQMPDHTTLQEATKHWGPDVESYGAPAGGTEEKVGTEEGAKEDTAFFQQAKKELPDATLSEQLKRAQELKETPVGTPEKPKVTEPTAKEYREALDANPTAATLTDSTQEQLEKYKRFKINTGEGQNAYFSIAPDGEISGLVNNGKSMGVIKHVVAEAMKNGGKYLSIWDTNKGLINMYKKFGFDPTQVVGFDADTYGPPSDELKAAWRKQGWKGDDNGPYPSVQYMDAPKTEPKGVHTPGEAESDEEMARRGADVPAKQYKDMTPEEKEEFAKNTPVSGGAPSKKMPTSDELFKKYGEAPDDPAHTAFLLKDGRRVAQTGTIHDEMLGGKATDDNPRREQFVNNEGAIRMRSHGTYGSRQFNLSIPESGISTKQLAQLVKWEPQMRTGTQYIEIARPQGKYITLQQGTGQSLEKAIRQLVPILPEGYPKEVAPVSGGAPDKPTTGRVNKFGEVVGDAEVKPNKSAMTVYVKPPEGFRVIGDRALNKGNAAKFSYGKYEDFETPAEAKAAAQAYADNPNNFIGDKSKGKASASVEKGSEVKSEGHNTPPENFTAELKPEGREQLKKLSNDSTIIVTPEGAVHSYDEYNPKAEDYTHSSLFNQILSNDKGELGKYQDEDSDSLYDPTGNYHMFQEAGGIRAFTTGPTEAGIELYTKAPAGTIAKALRVADALGREDTTLEIVDPDNSYKTVFSKSGTYEQVKNAVYDWADKNGKEVYPGEKENPSVSGGSQGADTKLPALAEKHLLPEEKEGVSKSPQQLERFTKVMSEIPKVKEFTDAAIAGAGERKWYQRSTQAFDAMSKEAPNYFDQEGDREKFTGMLAAGSPQQSVAMNLREALRVWTTYVDNGRPTGDALEKLLSKPSAEGGFTLPGAKIPNAMKALAGEPMWPDITKNKNFKVPSFRDNLTGMLQRVTNDGWMALFSGLKATDISSAHSYHPISVMVRAAADELGWEPAEAQAAVWAFIKTLTEKGKEAAEDPHQMRQYSEDFSDIIQHDPETRALLKDMGVNHAELDKRLAGVEAKPEPDSSGGRPSAEDSTRRAVKRVEEARGKGAIPAPKTGLLNFGEPGENEATSFNPDQFKTETSDVKVTPLSERPNKTILSVKVDGERAGQMSLTPVPELGEDAMEVSTSQLGEAFRGQGHGSEMYKQAIEYAKSKGVKALYSDTQVSTKADNVWQSMVRKGTAKWDSTAKRYKVTISPLGKIGK